MTINKNLIKKNNNKKELRQVPQCVCYDLQPWAFIYIHKEFCSPEWEQKIFYDELPIHGNFNFEKIL